MTEKHEAKDILKWFVRNFTYRAENPDENGDRNYEEGKEDAYREAVDCIEDFIVWVFGDD